VVEAVESIKDGLPVGIYYKVDSLFTTAMEGEGSDTSEWQRIFSTYFNLSIMREAASFVKEISKEVEENEIEFSNLFLDLAKHLGEDQWDGDSTHFIDLCEEKLNNLEIYINNLGYATRPLMFIPGRLIEDFVSRFTTISGYENIIFHIFIDEYENLFDYQQRVINTLLKHSRTNLVYNIGVRRKGLRENRTLNPQEVIQPPHDYRLYRPEDELTEAEYNNLLKNICRKRFEHAVVDPGKNGRWHDIEFYLGHYEITAEVKTIKKETRRELPFQKRLKEIIDSEVGDKKQTKELHRILAENEDPLINRLNLCLLLRQPTYRPTIEELKEELEKWKEGKSPKYKDWLHNAQLGLVFLLARDYRQHKMYFGFDVFSMLSSGIVRYFLELCLHAFNFAFSEGFSFNDPKPISMDVQTRAARYVSRYKIDDIETYSPHGRRLKRFILVLGSVFETLHKHRNVTLGEPEQNHFHTKTLELEDKDKALLDSAVMWTTLQERIPTKEKSGELSLETGEYHLNHIYCPYFEISYRRKRRLYIKPGLLHRMLSPNLNDTRAAIKILLRKHNAEPLSDEDIISHGSVQLSLFK
jgi:hypothetical protein